MEEKKFLSTNLLEFFFLSLKWAEQNILLAVCALKIVVFVEKNNVETIFFYFDKNHTPPPPLS